MELDVFESGVTVNLTLVSATPTERVPEDWNITVAEQEDGTGRLLGFSLSGTQIDPGNGPIFDLGFEASADEPISVSLSTANEVFSDPNAIPFSVTSAYSMKDAASKVVELALRS